MGLTMVISEVNVLAKCAVSLHKALNTIEDRSATARLRKKLMMRSAFAEIIRRQHQLDLALENLLAEKRVEERCVEVAARLYALVGGLHQLAAAADMVDFSLWNKDLWAMRQYILRLRSVAALCSSADFHIPQEVELSDGRMNSLETGNLIRHAVSQ